jgi:hypothetical protein
MANSTTDPALPEKSMTFTEHEPSTEPSTEPSIENGGELGTKEFTAGRVEGEADADETRKVTGVKVRPPSQILVLSSTTNDALQWFLVVTAILSSHMLFALDNTIVANIQPVQSPLSYPDTFNILGAHRISFRQSWRHLTVPVKYLGFL